MFGSFTIAAKTFCRPMCLSKKCLSAFPKKNQITYETLIKQQLFHKIPRHWAMAQFTLVGLFPRFTIAANFSWADPGHKKRKPFPKAIAKFKDKAFLKRIRSFTKPVLKTSLCTNFQGTGPWEGQVHPRRFVAQVRNHLGGDPAAKRRKISLSQSNLCFLFLVLVLFLLSFLFLFFCLVLFLFLFPFRFLFLSLSLFLFFFLFFLFLFLSLSFSFSVSFFFLALSLITLLHLQIKKTWGEKDAISMLNPIHYKYYKY